MSTATARSSKNMIAAPVRRGGKLRRRGLGSTAIGVVICVVLLFPLYWMVNVSLTKPSDLLSIPPSFFPTDPTFDGYVAAITQQTGPLLTSLVIAIGTVLLTLALSLPAAYAMAKFRVKATGWILFVFLLAQMIPGVVMILALFSIYSSLGLLNTIPGLILADATASVPFAVIVLRAFMIGIPDELLEAAKLDGASQARTFRSVVVPLSRNAIVTAGLFSFLFAWADFLNAQSLTTGNSVTTFTVGLYRYIGANNSNWNSIMATAVIASIPAAILLIVAQRYVAAGITAGAVKD